MNFCIKLNFIAVNLESASIYQLFMRILHRCELVMSDAKCRKTSTFRFVNVNSEQIGVTVKDLCTSYLEFRIRRYAVTVRNVTKQNFGERAVAEIRYQTRGVGGVDLLVAGFDEN